MRAGQLDFGFPITAFAGARDARVSADMVRRWAAFAPPGRFELLEVDGPHLWPLERGPKAAWLSAIVARMPALP